MKLEISQSIVFGDEKNRFRYGLRVYTGQSSAYEDNLSPDKMIETLTELIESAAEARTALQTLHAHDESERKGFFLKLKRA